MENCTRCNAKNEELYWIQNQKKLNKLCKRCVMVCYDDIVKNVNNDKYTMVGERTIRYLVDHSKNDHEQFEEEIKKEKMQKQMDSLIGMEKPKEEMRQWLKINKGREKLQNSSIKIKNSMMNVLITGSPGTGKTTFARMVASVLHMSGMIKEDKMIEVQAGDLIGEHVGHTIPKTTAVIEKALGGVLFLDEAYRLAGDGLSGNKGNYGQEALETIMDAMENKSEELVVIFACYEDRLTDLFSMNDGLESRFSKRFHMPDYTPEELTLIGTSLLTQKGYDLTDCVDDLASAIHKKVNNGVLLGNARTIRTMTESIIAQHMIRIGEESVEKIEKILPIDIQKATTETYSSEQRNGLDRLYKEAIEELDEMQGMDMVKKKMRRFGNTQMVQRKRKEKGFKTRNMSNHMFFKGSPGTGKTTVARIVGKILRGAGVLSNGHLVEVTKDDLTGSSMQTTRQVKKIIQKAKGGVLFLDEAYSLKNDKQGKEALDMLIKEMEENYEDLVVILAGYEKEMNELLQMNPGLYSRIPHHFDFTDYKAEELTQMTIQLIQKEEYHLTCDAVNILKEQIEELWNNKMIQGNGRWVRNFFDAILDAQSQRIIETEAEAIETIEEMDILDAICEMENKLPATLKKEKTLEDKILNMFEEKKHA